MLREVAEYPNSFMPLSPGEERIDTGRYTLCLGHSKLSNTVQRQRFGAEAIDDVLAEVRTLLRERGRTRTQWEIGSAATPANLVSELLGRGLARDRDPIAVAVALAAEPPAPPVGLVVRPVRTLEDYAAAYEVQFEAFGVPPEEVVERRATMAESWRAGPKMMHAVWLDGEIVSVGSCAPTPVGLALFGGATLPRARGRGAYRALVYARWREATSRRLPALVTQAGAMSRPILERLGFAPVGRVEMLLDEFDAD